MSFLLFDEIEKASDALWQLLLGILDKATVTLGDNRKVDLSKAVIFMTSNLGGRDISEKMCEQYGFVGSTHESNSKLNHKIEQAGIRAARKTFFPEFMNRIDRVVTFRPLDCDQLADVLNIELGFVAGRHGPTL